MNVIDPRPIILIVLVVIVLAVAGASTGESPTTAIIDAVCQGPNGADCYP